MVGDTSYDLEMAKNQSEIARQLYEFKGQIREINGKNTGGSMQIIKWQDENGREFTPNFKEMNEREQKKIHENNNPVELNHKIIYPG